MIKNTLILIMFLITGCAGFYTKKENIQAIKPIQGNINVYFDITFINQGRLIDEIEISSKYSLESKVKNFKEDILSYLRKSNPEIKINVINGRELEKECTLKFKFQETSLSSSPLLSTLTLFIWPYIDERIIKVDSALMNKEKLISHSVSENKYKVVLSLFLIPIAPFYYVKDIEGSAWQDSFKDNLQNIDFSKCVVN